MREMKPDLGLARRDDEPAEKIDEAIERLAWDPRLKTEGALLRA